MYADMRKMERLVMDSDLDWTIVRPSGLFDALTVSDYVTAEAYVPGKFTARVDLANCMLRQLASDEYVRKTIAVATYAGQPPNVIAFLWREGIKKQVARG
jgi:uncharacterized protein YbjT (DUF2867 family)